jgi:hypothetical protein
MRGGGRGVGRRGGKGWSVHEEGRGGQLVLLQLILRTSTQGWDKAGVRLREGRPRVVGREVDGEGRSASLIGRDDERGLLRRVVRGRRREAAEESVLMGMRTVTVLTVTRKWRETG